MTHFVRKRWKKLPLPPKSPNKLYLLLLLLSPTSGEYPIMSTHQGLAAKGEDEAGHVTQAGGGATEASRDREAHHGRGSCSRGSPGGVWHPLRLKWNSTRRGPVNQCFLFFVEFSLKMGQILCFCNSRAFQPACQP